MDERLAIGDYQDFIAEQLVAQHTAQHLRAPRRTVLRNSPAHVQVAQQCAQVARQRMHVLGRLALSEPLQNAFAAQKRTRAGNPAAPGKMRYEHRYQRDDHPKHHEQPNQIASGICTSAFDEAHVMNEHQRADLVASLINGMSDDVQRSLRKMHHGGTVGAGSREWLAAQRLRIGRGLVAKLPLLIAKGERVQALILQRAVKERIDLCGCPLLDELRELIFERVGD